MLSINKKVFSRNLRMLVEKSPFKAAEIAEKLGISRGTMTDYMDGRYCPKPDRLKELCQILGVAERDLTTDFEKNDDEVELSPELIKLARELFENPQARALYNAITALDQDTQQSFLTILNKIDKEE